MFSVPHIPKLFSPLRTDFLPVGQKWNFRPFSAVFECDPLDTLGHQVSRISARSIQVEYTSPAEQPFTGRFRSVEDNPPANAPSCCAGITSRHLAPSHPALDLGDTASNPLIEGVTRKIPKILKISPTTANARRAYFPSNHGNYRNPSLLPWHDPSPPLRLPQLHRQLLSRSRSCWSHRCMPPLLARVHSYSA